MPVATRPRPRPAGRIARGSRRRSLLNTLQRWAPPGGWLLAALGLLALSTAAGTVFPSSPAGMLLDAAVGHAAFLVAGWLLWLTWAFGFHRFARWTRTAAAAVLSITLLLGLTLREPGGGGLAGELLLQGLDSAFGHATGLAIVSIAAAIALVTLIGFNRIMRWLAVLGSYVRPLIARHSRPAIRVRVPGRTSPTFGERERDGVREPVILGPVSLEQSPPRPQTATPRQSEHAPWKRPDQSILGRASDAGAFSPAELKARAKIIEETLTSFNIDAHVVEVQQGPAITQFGVDPAPGVAVNRIVSRQNDLALRLGAPTLRVLAPVPGRPMVGIEVPNSSVALVKLGDLIASPQFGRQRLPIGVGMDVSGKPVVADLTRAPHLLVAGATGSGKSVCINSVITSLLVTRTPDEVQLVLIDPKQVEMSQYRGLPHLRLPVVTEMDRVVAALRWTVIEMERRYTRFSDVGARNIVAYNERFPDDRLMYLVVVVDELADLMMTAPEDVERLICRIAQLGRAAGVHLVVATQRPSVDVVTGLIKANLPTRIAFAVSSMVDSRVILDRVGAERLLGRGDALYQAGDEMNPRRVQGAFAADEEIEAVVSHWRAQGDSSHTEADEAELERLARQEDPEERLLAQARHILAEHDGDVTPGYLARKLRIGSQ
ncbi:MAG TPA: DNA translocase FtsK, partial [Chloroflexota bacterium]|nr:DNA translocase FtsK [Chloroflexota bacterium]